MSTVSHTSLVAVASRAVTPPPGWLTWPAAVADLIAGHALTVTVTAILALAAAYTARLLARARARRARPGGGFEVLLRPPPRVEPASGEAFWRHLLGLQAPAWRRWLFGQPHLGFEYRWTGRELHIAVWVAPGVPPSLIAAAATAAWPGTTTETRPAANPLPGDALTAGGALRLRRAGLPLHTDHDTDPLRPLLAAARGARDTEHACVQILARPAHPTGRRGGAGRWLARALLGLAEELLTAPRTRTHHSAAARHDPRRAVTERHARAAVDKAIEPGWEVAVRYAVAAEASTRGDAPVSDAAAERLAGRAHALAAAAGIHTGTHNALRRHRLRHPARTLAARSLGHGDLLTCAELAALAHLPADESVPELDRARARPVAPPVAATGGGRGVISLGRSPGGRAVTLSIADARHHTHVIGGTGSGKSTFLANTGLAYAKAGRALIAVDPKGDTIDAILERLDAHTARRVVLIDPAQPHGPAINPLDTDDLDLAVDQICGIFTRVFPKAWGPRADDCLRSACLTLGEYYGTSLAHVTPLLTNRAVRARLTADLSDPAGLGGFWTWFEALSPAMQSQVISPVTSRLRAFLLRPFVRDTLCAPITSHDLRHLIDHGGILLARLPKGVLGEETSRLLGSLLVARVWQAATGRATVGEHQRPDTALIIDEAHNFLTLPRALDEMLAEARGYRLSMVLAHQNLGQMPREMQLALSANARNKIFFACSPEDARVLARHTTPHLDEHDLIHTDPYIAACKLVADGAGTPAFTLYPHPPAEPQGHADTIRGDASERARKAATKAAELHQQRIRGATRRAGARRRPLPKGAFTTTTRQKRDSGDDSE